MSYLDIADKYAEDVLSGRITAGREIVAACRRWKKDRERTDIEIREKDPDFVIGIIQKTLVHAQGEDANGEPLLGKPFILQPWQVFVTYNLLGWYWTGTQLRRFKEAFIMVARKNGKTSFVAALAWAVSILQRKSGSKVYMVAAALKQALEPFRFLLFSLRYNKLDKVFRTRDNNQEHSIAYTFTKVDGTPDGTMDLQAMPANPEVQDSFNSNFVIADEIAAYKSPAQYNRFKEAGKAYANRLIVGITTAGDNANSFGYRHMEYAVKVATGVVDDDSFFSFVARADQDENGDVDYLNPEQHKKANLSYGVTVRPADLMAEAKQAQNDPQKRKDFLSRSLNIYTTAMRSYFDIEEFRRSDSQYHWTIDELAKLPIDWFGGADLSRMHDLTAAALYGRYQGVDIIITHAFFPVTMAARKAEEDSIPLFGWKEDGWLTLCDSPTVNMADIVNWFVEMRKKGFRIRRVGHDRKFAGEEYFPAMKAAGFNIIDQPQYFYVKSQGFRHIERAAKNGVLYYLHSEAYEYCVSNVHAVEKTDDAVQYEKIQPTQRIDLFDASVFACVQFMEQEEKTKAGKRWWGEE